MRLETARSPAVPKPTADDIRAAMSDDMARGEYIMLSRAAEVYMQAGGEAGDQKAELEAVNSCWKLIDQRN